MDEPRTVLHTVQALEISMELLFPQQPPGTVWEMRYKMEKSLFSRDPSVAGSNALQASNDTCNLCGGIMCDIEHF
jgi:hypothetical protein